MSDEDRNRKKKEITFDDGKDNVRLAKNKNSYTIPVGPINVALHEPFRVYFEEDGEEIIDVDVKPGYCHVGMEKIATKRNPIQFLPISQRVCGICSHIHAYTFARAVESALDIDTPPRAQYIRAIIAELERIHSHLLWAGSAAHEIGFESLFYYIWKERENVVDILEYVTGNRVNYEINMIGGVRRDLTKDRIEKIRESLSYYADIKKEIELTIMEDKTVKMRTRNAGVLEKDEAARLGAVGPTARGSNLRKDIRHDQPYSAYSDFDYDMVMPNDIFGETHGDVYDRMAVRIKEIETSIELAKKFLDNLPKGDILAEEKMPSILNQIKSGEGEGIARTEAPRGEVIYYFETEEGDENTSTLKIKTPTYSNLMSLPPMFLGDQIADIPIVAASIDPCMTCMDRVVVVEGDQEKTYSKEELVDISKKETRRIKNG